MFTISFLSAKTQEDNCVLSFMALYDFLVCRDRDHLCVREREQLLIDVMEANGDNVKGR